MGLPFILCESYVRQVAIGAISLLIELVEIMSTDITLAPPSRFFIYFFYLLMAFKSA
jgi:hypothetical protein